MVDPIETTDVAGSARRDASYAAMMDLLGLGVNRTAGLYDVPGFGKATAGQVAMYVCFREAVANEQLAASMLNLVARRSALIKAQSSVLQQVQDAPPSSEYPADIGDYPCQRTGENPSLRDFLIYECEIEASVVDSGFVDFEGQQALALKIQEKIQSAMSENELRQIDLQMAVNRAAVCVTTGANLVSELNVPGFNLASRLK